MCGIALIVSGIHLNLSSLLVDSNSPSRITEELIFSMDDLKAALRRRGPDSLGSKKVLLNLNSNGDKELYSMLQNDEMRCEMSCSSVCGSVDTETCFRDNGFFELVAEMNFIGATLQLRGIDQIFQPLVDKYGNVLVYNGEIFGGIHVASDSNDAEVLMKSLKECCSCGSNFQKESCHHRSEGHESVPNVLSQIKGPWAVIYWQENARTLWFGRDPFGRRSLLVHWPTTDDLTFLLSSVSPVPSAVHASDCDAKSENAPLSFWQELPCGVYSIAVDVQTSNKFLIGNVIRHEYANPMLQELIRWERASVEPKSDELYRSYCENDHRQHDSTSASSEMVSTDQGSIESSVSMRTQILLNTLMESVMRRTTLHTVHQATTSDRQWKDVPVAILFSGGLDSMLLAALLDKCLDPIYEIDLLNVSFDGQSAPDRISARAGVQELKRVAPFRRWKLVEIDAELSKLTFETKHVMSLINPANTYMDLNIGIALWLAANGDGWVYEGYSNGADVSCKCVKYKSKARIVLVGAGADEQCAGYGRHRTSFRRASWLGLHEEMKLDMKRIWKRNLGRDDRCIADNGKEARFPFLDEDVIRLLLDIPLWEVADLNQPTGVGDKKILREIARLLGLDEASILPKRAIQFGSRIARESNKKNFGSNRAANQVSAGSARIHLSSNS